MNTLKEKQCLSLLMRFRPEEMPDIVPVAFNGLSWKIIKNSCVSLKLTFWKMRNLANVIIKVYSDLKPTTEDVNSAMMHLLFFDAMLHKSHKWNGIILLNKEDNFPQNLSELYAKISQAYRIEARNVDVIIKVDGDITFIMLVEKIITKRGVKSGKPFFACFNFNLKKMYGFYAPKQPENTSGVNHLSLLTQAFGFSTYKNSKFCGNDVRSMFGMIQNHEKNQCQEVVVFDSKKYCIEGNIVDFTQGRNRMNYALNILPIGQTNLKEFHVNSLNEFRGDLPISPTETIRSEMKINVSSKSHSVEDVFRELMANGLMEIPPPQYIARLPYLDRNFVKIRSSKEPENSAFTETWLEED